MLTGFPNRPKGMELERWRAVGQRELERPRPRTLLNEKINWYRIGIEGVVIVGSILLAFGIDAWWDGVQGERKAQTGLTELLQDLAADSVELKSSATYAQHIEAFSLWALSHLKMTGIREDSASRALAFFFRQNPYQPVGSSYAGLRESSQLGLIADSRLRNAIISYYETEQTQHVWRTEVLMTLQHNAWEAAELDLQVATDSATAEFLGRSVELTRPWAQIPTDPRLPSRLRNLGSRAAVVEGHSQRLIRINAELQKSIREALGRH